MLFFECDYNNGTHPDILKRLTETNEEALPGYGEDHYSMSAKEKIKAACDNPEAEVFLLNGGTQTNQIVIASHLSGYQGVIAADTGHISVHEAGAVESTGHKVLTLPHIGGKIAAGQVKEYLDRFFADESSAHMVQPGMVYISYPTEYGTLYSKQELADLYKVCREYHLPLFIDGARLGYGLMSSESDLTLPEFTHLCDVFYIGGTKVGALCGEAVVFTHGNMPSFFFTTVKQHGALSAKGRLVGISFDTLFTDDLYFKISRHADRMADELKNVFREKGYRFLMETPTNQIFVILENGQLEKIREYVNISVWEPVDETHTAVRFATSWATKPADLDALKEYL